MNSLGLINFPLKARSLGVSVQFKGEDILGHREVKACQEKCLLLAR